MSEAIIVLKKEDDREPLLSAEDLDTRETDAIASEHTTVKSKEKEKKVILGMVVKKDTTIWNLIAMSAFPGLMAGNVSFLSALLPLILQSEDFYAIDKSELGQKTAESHQYGQLAVIICLPFIAIFVDLSSRRIPSSFGMIMCALLTWAIPVISPNFPALCFARAMITICTVMVDAIPFVSDYVKKESRGLATCMGALSVGIFQIINFTICVPYSKTVSYYECFSTVAISMLILTVCCLLMLGNKNLKFNDQSRMRLDGGETENSQFAIEFKKLTNVMTSQVLVSPDWIYIFLSSAISGLTLPMYSTYLMLWINSFVEKGVLADENDVKSAYVTINIWSTPVALMSVFLSMIIVDKVQPVWLIAPGFLLRSLCCALTLYVVNPTEWLALAAISLFLFSSCTILQATMTAIHKNAPETARGSILTIQACAMSAGYFMFNGAAGILFDKSGPTAPFVVLGCLDLVLVIYTLTSHQLGHLFNGNSANAPSREQQDDDEKISNHGYESSRDGEIQAEN